MSGSDIPLVINILEYAEFKKVVHKMHPDIIPGPDNNITKYYKMHNTWRTSESNTRLYEYNHRLFLFKVNKFKNFIFRKEFRLYKCNYGQRCRKLYTKESVSRETEYSK